MIDTPAPPVLVGSDYDQERAKWEQPHRTFREYPKMLYQARLVDAAVQIRTWTVSDAEAEAEAAREGWSRHPTAAREVYEAQQTDIANAAAVAAGLVRGMSVRAQREYQEAERLSDEHVVDVTPATIRSNKRAAG